MNVVPREKRVKPKMKSKCNNDFIRKDTSLGIRGATSLVPLHPFSAPKVTSTSNKAPKYQFDKDEVPLGSTRRPAMGPPSGPPKSFKRKIIHSASSHLESSSSSRPHPRVLASDSAAVDTSHDMCTPRNRPTALRYISSSSRGGYSGTRSARSTSVSAADASVILAISEGRGMARGEIGIAAIDLRHPHLVLCQFSDTLLYTHTLTKINFFNPIEIIVPHTFCEGVQPNQLYQLIRDRYPLVNLVTVQRRHFNDAAGRQNIQTLCAPQYSGVYLQVVHKFYAVTAAAAVLKYVEYIQCIVFARESLKIEYHSSENTMIIDVGTATQLELVQPLVPSAGPTCCLLGVLGPTYTIGGIRALRASILQPSCNKDYIESRLDAIQDLIDNDTGLIVDLQDVIKKLADVDKILLLCMESANQNMDKVGEAQLNQTLLLKVTMDLVPKLVEALNGAVSGRLRKIKMDFENPHYNEIAERIKRIIQDDAHLEKGAMGSLQRCFAVKPDINGLLDVARRTYSELIEDIQKIVEQLSETYDLTLRLNQNMMKGFHIVLPLAPKSRRCFNIEDLPPIFIQASSVGSYIRPEFNSYMDVRNSVHPLLDYNSQVLPVPNDILATPEHNFTIITGPNMGGKSIYIKQVAIMQVMAQIGCFLPATNAILRLCDRIFSRIGFNDSVELNASTYVFEIKETQHILKGLTPTSLIIIDELCRGTCVEEGTSVAWAICEELIMSNAFTFFTTHFMYLTRLEEHYFNVVNRHTAVTEEEVGTPENPQKRLVYQHKIEPGFTKIEHYGLALAAKTNLPEDTVKLALELAELISSNTIAQEIRTPGNGDAQSLYNLNATIQKECRKYGHSEETVKRIVIKFKADNPQICNRLNAQCDNRTDWSAECSYVPYSKEKSILSNDESNNDNELKNTRTPIPTSLVENLELIEDFQHRNYASVQSSEQLLNSVIHNDDSAERDDQNTSDVEMIGSDTDELSNLEVHETKQNNAEESNDQFQNSYNNKMHGQTPTSHNTDINEEDTNAIETSSIDSEIAEALTQIVEEYSSKNVTHSQRSSDMSIDDDLVNETINEINDELSTGLSSIENIILTPPMSFRDI
ncbi:mutS protein homolog 4-like isoform X2 [Spodoptera litura]|uniref:MutS protein homolog 4-like isoform X2 n=1 Tax=Spodoptera litura TaxID=69820 RepID=A0A9J7J0V6_SPOLT|nr:mutS protein homolog 4-like isoform X2 [Spodoptera litura]